MEPLTLTVEALREPWRLWTGHLVHFGWDHALANAVALAVPWILAAPEDRRRLALVMLLVPPLLSLLLLPGLGGGQYRGASGLACALWAFAGSRLAGSEADARLGQWLLGALAFKLAAEAASGTGLFASADGWRALPAAHLWGALLGLTSAGLTSRAEVPHSWRFHAQADLHPADPRRWPGLRPDLPPDHPGPSPGHRP